MEWTQIANGWAEMTDRLRGVTRDTARPFGRPLVLDRETGDGTGDNARKTSVETAFADHSLPSGQ